MRTMVLVMVAYVVTLILASTWHRLPIGFLSQSAPDIGAVTAAYIGLTSRRGLAPAMLGSVSLGYLIDLITGTPVGFFALLLGMICIIAIGAQRSFLVRGPVMIIGFCGVVAVAAGILTWVIKMAHSIPRESLGLGTNHLLFTALTTMIAGPLVLRGFRRIDAAFARTERERAAALEGISP
jgi:hypothetical protein